ncbi:hypothetical protein Alg130_11923, partial [Pyrenophora tritici-repentis]
MIEAGCYTLTTGDYGLTVDGADALVDNFCNIDLAGYFNKGQTKYRCSQLNKNLKVEFWVVWMGHGGLTLNKEDCKMRLHEEINHCRLGGESVVADWFFR